MTKIYIENNSFKPLLIAVPVMVFRANRKKLTHKMRYLCKDPVSVAQFIAYELN